MNENKKVPMAVLSCFFIAFILQGMLKLGGILIFEKSLDWQIFKIIDSKIFLQVIYYSILSIIAIYCLSFACTTKPYSKKWYHYIIIITIPTLIAWFRITGTYTQQLNILIDILLYVIIPFVINITSTKKIRLFNEFSVFSVVILLTINIFGYFYYLGLNYWSGILNSLLTIKTEWLISSANFLIQLEVYIGLIMYMLSLNLIIEKIKEIIIMFMPINIASKLAKKKEKREKLLIEITKLEEEIKELEAKENAKKA